MLGRSGRRILATFLTVALTLVAPGRGTAATPDADAREAEALHRRALERGAERSFDVRRLAITELERASLLDPGRSQIWLDLGRLCLEAGQRSRGRSCYERATRVSPNDAGAQLLLGSAWKWEWLSSFDDSALVRAHRCFARATELAPGRADTWGALAALELARGYVGSAVAAASKGCAAESSAWEPRVALACAWFRAGALERADQGFRNARGLVPSELRRHFDQATWLADDRGEIAVAADARISDPDLTTPENEAELDYLTRVGLALLLFRDERGPHWDMRSELFVRYGPPATVEVNPLASPLGYWYERHRSEMPGNFLSYAPEPLGFPYNVQAWAYPELGMRVELWDRSLRQSFELPVAVEEDPDPRPNPVLLAARPDLIAMAGGRGVFRAMPPGAEPMEASGHIARFPTDRGAILVAHLMAAADPADTLRGSWAVVASDGSVLARASGSLSASTCDPTGRRVADFTVAAPPGDYRVDLAVSGAGGRRGIVRLEASVVAAPAGLVLSDLVLLCGMEGTVVGADAVRFEPNLERRFTATRPLSVYFEIDHLAPGADGRARFAYTYAVRPVASEGSRKRRAAVAFAASREETHDGTRRRQFVSVPLRSIKVGTYDLEIEVRDLVAGSTATGVVRFVRE